MSEKKRKMLELWESVKSCYTCEISKFVRNKCFGDGFVDADIVLVGEGPGMDEDETGKVFVGNAGRILTNCLKAAGLDRKKLFICNVVKCHPPKTVGPRGPVGNRAPLAEEITNCLPFLKVQLSIVQPKIVVALGGKAASTLLNRDVKVTKAKEDGGMGYHETYTSASSVPPPWWIAGDAKVIVTLHPQYLGYREGDEDLKSKYIRLFREIREMVNE